MADIKVSFSHVHLYVDQVKSVQVYKDLEKSLTKFSESVENEISNKDDSSNLAAKQKIWRGCNCSENVNCSESFTSQNRDVVDQLIVGFGFRVTGYRFHPPAGMNTRTVLVTSTDPQGVQVVVSAVDPSLVDDTKTAHDEYKHFNARNLQTFFQAHSNRQGIAVLGFYVSDVELVYQRYQQLHPKLISTFHEYKEDGVKILEVFAYYTAHSQDSSDDEKSPDIGTVLRFVETANNMSGVCPLPGLTNIDAVFDTNSQPAYCDHWVSNVFSRTEFLSTLNDTLGFTPKVDFNAGVVAAGEAQIESTVTGNESNFTTNDRDAAFRDQSQVYLPINNALTRVGHVHGFLDELGQGIQHVASRVEDLVTFVKKCNEIREITAEGFTFLNIPRSYYGVLSTKYLVDNVGIPVELAEHVLRVCEEHGIVAEDGAVDLNLKGKDIVEVLDDKIRFPDRKLYEENKEQILKAILRSRYANLHSLLQNHVAEETYLGIVQNKILVDVQGEDILYQIFTCNILQRKPGEEAPFFEFIQRVCSECASEDGCPTKIKPGCGGFGIRNFLTLFLSIEVSKAMLEASDANRCGDERRRSRAQQRVDCFTSQLNESNPILTEISNAMTEEGLCKGKYEAATVVGDDEVALAWKSKMEAACQKKQEWNKKLMDCSALYEKNMRAIREAIE